MTAADLAAVLLGVATLAVVGALSVVTIQLLRVLRSVRREVAQLTEEVSVAVDELHEVVGRARGEADRADAVLASVEEVAGRVDAASELAYETFSKPVIKAVSLGSGTARAARRLRGKD
jgi:hypothetical protein